MAKTIMELADSTLLPLYDAEDLAKAAYERAVQSQGDDEGTERIDAAAGAAYCAKEARRAVERLVATLRESLRDGTGG